MICISIVECKGKDENVLMLHIDLNARQTWDSFVQISRPAKQMFVTLKYSWNLGVSGIISTTTQVILLNPPTFQDFWWPVMDKFLKDARVPGTQI